MAAKGTPAWYRRHDTPVDPRADLERLRLHARANGMFHEGGERAAFEDWFRRSRAGKGATYAVRMLERLPSGDYAAESTQRHWWTWCNAAGGGRILPKYDPYKLAADRLEAAQRLKEAQPS